MKRMTTTRKILRKSKQLAKQRETQVWLLASPNEADQLAHGHVPLDIKRQAEQALRHIVSHASDDSSSDSLGMMS